MNNEDEREVVSAVVEPVRGGRQGRASLGSSEYVLQQCCLTMSKLH